VAARPWRFRSVLLGGAAVVAAAGLWLGVGDGVQAQVKCRTARAIGAPIDPSGISPGAVNFDVCTNRATKLDQTLKASGGPYISREQAQRSFAGPADAPSRATKVRAYFTTHSEARRMLDDGAESPYIDSDREIWLVVATMRIGDGPKPSLAPGVPTPDPNLVTNFKLEIDATTGETLREGSVGRVWPPGLPPDTPEDLARDARRTGPTGRRPGEPTRTPTPPPATPTPRPAFGR
jgi:hypothetical protein